MTKKNVLLPEKQIPLRSFKKIPLRVLSKEFQGYKLNRHGVFCFRFFKHCIFSPLDDFAIQLKAASVIHCLATKFKVHFLLSHLETTRSENTRMEFSQKEHATDHKTNGILGFISSFVFVINLMSNPFISGKRDRWSLDPDQPRGHSMGQTQQICYTCEF